MFGWLVGIKRHFKSFTQLDRAKQHTILNF